VGGWVWWPCSCRDSGGVRVRRKPRYQRGTRERDRRKANPEHPLSAYDTGTAHCPTTKRQYVTKAKARDTLGKMARKNGTGMGGQNRLNVYKCAECGWFHIGHRPTIRP